MSSRNRGLALAALACALVCAGPARAQGAGTITEIAETTLSDVNPWGVGPLSSTDGALSVGLWQGSAATDLEPLLADLNPTTLGPAGRQLVRKAILSSGRAPEGDALGLLQHRLRLMARLGEAGAADALATRFPGAVGAFGGPVATAERLLLRGEVAGACAMLSTWPDLEVPQPPPLPQPEPLDPTAAPTPTPVPTPPPQPVSLGPPPLTPVGAYGLRLRALCHAAAGDTEAADVAIDVALARGVEAAWLFTTLRTLAAPPDAPRPLADYSSGLHLSASVLVGLRAPGNAVDLIPPEAIGLMLSENGLPLTAQVELGARAYQAGLLTSADYRARLSRWLAAEAAEPGLTLPTSALRVFTELAAARLPPMPAVDGPAVDEPAPDPQTTEGATLAPDTASLPPRVPPPPPRLAMLLGNYLAGEAINTTRFRAAAALVIEDIAALSPNADDTAYAHWLALAALSAGESGLALGWYEAMDANSPPSARRQIMALLRLNGLFGPGEAGTLPRDALGQPPHRALALLAAAGAPLSSAERASLSDARPSPGASLSEGTLARLQAAALAGSTGEAALLAARAVGPDPQRLATRDLMGLLLALRTAGLEADAANVVTDVLLGSP